MDRTAKAVADSRRHLAALPADERDSCRARLAWRLLDLYAELDRVDIFVAANIMIDDCEQRSRKVTA